MLPATVRAPERAASTRALRVVTLLLALFFLYEGVSKFQESRLWTNVFIRIGFGLWFRYVAGAVEVAGAMLLLLPRGTQFGALLLAATMIGALLAHVFAVGMGPQTVVVAALLVALLRTAWVSRA